MYYQDVENATTEELELMKQDEILAVTAYRVERARTGFLAEPYPIFSYTNDENEVRGRYRGDLSAYLQTMRVAFITGVADIEADWETYQATMLAMGLNELLAAEQTAYDRYAVNLK